MGKGEISRYEQFLLFPQCLKKACFPGVSIGVIVWEWVNKNLTNMYKRSSKMIDAKGENVSSQHFLFTFSTLFKRKRN